MTTSFIESELNSQPTQLTAHFTWRELLGPYATERNWTGGIRPADADRGALPCGTPQMRQRIGSDQSIGALLVWNKSLDEEGGDLIMFTGQTCEQERRVVTNATWMASCGTVYAASRVGTKAYKAAPDYRFRIGGRAGDLHFGWLIPNDRDIEGLRR
jgi:hypothetical protein